MISIFFFLSGLFSANIHDSQDDRGGGRRVEVFFKSSLPLPPGSQTLIHKPGD